MSETEHLAVVGEDISFKLTGKVVIRVFLLTGIAPVLFDKRVIKDKEVSLKVRQVPQQGS